MRTSSNPAALGVGGKRAFDGDAPNGYAAPVETAIQVLKHNYPKTKVSLVAIRKAIREVRAERVAKRSPDGQVEKPPADARSGKKP